MSSIVSPQPTTSSTSTSQTTTASPPNTGTAMTLDPTSTATTMTSGPTAMISGHTDLPQHLFDKHYIPQLTVAVASGANFILGDAKGVDAMALTWLLAHTTEPLRNRITVFCSRAYNVPRLEGLGVSVVLDTSNKPGAAGGRGKGGRDAGNPNASRQRHLDRDARMTAASDFDILYVRTDEEARVFYGEKWRKRVSATEMNRDRRRVVSVREREGDGGGRV